jgi:hypothetical protein
MSSLLDKHLINHVVFALDASDSMWGRNAQQLIKIADAEIAFLAQRSDSKELNQETRVAIYDFSDDVRCIVSERDVMRLPSIKDVYKTRGMTRMVDATILVLDDFGLVSQKYGDHAFLLYVLTDGVENASSYQNRAALGDRLASLPDNVTVAFLVPDERGKRSAMQYGCPESNIAIWNVNAADGMEKVGQVVRQATENFMVSRATGLRSTTSLFNMGSEAVNAATVAQALTPLSPDEYALVPVTVPLPSNDGKPWEIKQFANHCGYQYRASYTGYYQFIKTKKKPSEEVTPLKKIIVVNKHTRQAYGGAAARKLLNLPDNKTVRIHFDHNEDYDIYILSGSVNRHLVTGTKLLILKDKE